MIFAEILGPDLLVILVVVALLFGSSQLPKLARSLGSAKSEFERGVHEGAGGLKTGGQKEDTVTMTRAELHRLLGRGDESPTRQPNA